MAGVSAQPRDALVMSGLLRDAGVGEHEPRVINQMLEFAYRYSTNILEDARAFADLAAHSRVEADDVAAAIEVLFLSLVPLPPSRSLPPLAAEPGGDDVRPAAAAGPRPGARQGEERRPAPARPPPVRTPPPARPTLPPTAQLPPPTDPPRPGPGTRPQGTRPPTPALRTGLPPRPAAAPADPPAQHPHGRR